jgi:hypothetical protein
MFRPPALSAPSVACSGSRPPVVSRRVPARSGVPVNFQTPDIKPNLSRVVAASSPPLPPPPPPPTTTTTTTTTTTRAWVFEPTIGQKTAQGGSISFDVSNCNGNIYGAAKIESGRAHRSRRDRIRQQNSSDLFRRAPRACAGRRLCSGARDSGRSRPFRRTGAAPRRCVFPAVAPARLSAIL